MNNDIKPIEKFDLDSFISPSEILSEVETLIQETQKPSDNIGIFKAKTANQWMAESKLRPIPKRLFDSLWFEGYICILLADTKLGKYILTVQICDSISRARPIRGFAR